LLRWALFCQPSGYDVWVQEQCIVTVAEAAMLQGAKLSLLAEVLLVSPPSQILCLE